jgi:hypothetical protein
LAHSTGADMSGPDLSKAIYLLIIGGFAFGFAFFSLRSLIRLAKLHHEKPCMGRIVRKRADTDDGTVYYLTGDPKNSYLADSRFRRSRFRAMCAWLLLAVLMAYIAYSFITQCVMRDICPS